MGTSTNAVNLIWFDYSIETVFGGKNSENVRYLQLFLADYVALFGGKVNPGCKRCVNNYLSKYKTKISQNMKTKSNSDYVLKSKYEGLQIGLTGVTVNNKNITNEMALELLKIHPAHKIFDKYPELTDIDSTNNTIAIAAGFKVSKANKEQLKAFAAAQNIQLTSEDLDKPNLVKEITTWLNQPLASVEQNEDDKPDFDSTNQQFATADNFDLTTATTEEKIAFIEKYEIDYAEKADNEAFTEEEITTIINTWLSQDTLG